MLQHIGCPALCRAARSTTKTMSGGRYRGFFSSSTSTSSNNGRGGCGYFSGRRGPPWPTRAGASAAAIGGVAVACIAATASSRTGSALAAPPTNPALSVVVEEEQGEEEKENAALVAAAHELRRSLTPPHQSLFRVVCILVYEDFSGKIHRITGTNAEASTIGGSICAERAAMCKLREASDCKRVTKVVVVTDNPGPLAPGVLCREFLSAHLSPSTPVVMAGAGGGGCDVVGGLLYEELDQKPSPEVAERPGTSANDSSSANGGSTGTGAGTSSSQSRSNTGAAAVAVAQTSVASRAPASPEPASSTCDCRAAAAGVGGDGAPPSTATTPRVKPPVGDAPGVLTAPAGSSKGELEPEGGVVAGQEPEGGHVDVCTVGDLYPWRNMYGITGRQELLRLGFLRQQVAEELATPGLAETLGLDSGVLAAHDAAWRATAEDKRDGVHPIRYAAVALFTDGEAEIAHQLKALEYGATLDPVTLLAPAMIRRAKDGIRPSWIIVCDQFGLMHAPFAQARTFLSEHGFGETKVALHAEDGTVVVVKAKDLVPTVVTSSR